MRTQNFELEHHVTRQKERFSSGEYHVCGILIDVNPQKMDAVVLEIENFPGCIIHESHPDGRLAATVEDTELFSSYDQIVELQTIDGVLAVSLISHFFE